MFRCHGQIDRVRCLFDTTSCGACLKEYRTFGKLQVTCGTRSRVEISCNNVGSIYILSLDWALEKMIAFVLIMMVLFLDKLVPALITTLTCWSAGSILDHVRSFMTVWLNAALNCMLYTLIIAYLGFRIAQALLKFPGRTMWTRSFSSSSSLRKRTDLVALPACVAQALFQALTSPTIWPMFEDDLATPDSGVLPNMTLETCEAWAKDLADYEHPWVRAEVPRIFYQERIFLHLFSSRGRPGDLQWFMEAFQVAHPDLHLVVASLDLVIGSHWGDLGKPEIRQFWFDAAFKGRIAALLGGPPCCAYSKARGRQNDDDDSHGGPRVVRDSAHPWGFDSLSIREMLQVADGRMPPGFAVAMLYGLLVTGGSGLLEHPDQPTDPALASIWRLPILRLLLAMHEVQWIPIAQGLLGASSAKPIGLLALRLPTLLKEFQPQSSGGVTSLRYHWPECPRSMEDQRFEGVPTGHVPSTGQQFCHRSLPAGVM